MLGVAPADEGSRRRLPQWMLRISSADQVVKSGNVEVNKKHSEEEFSFHACSSDPSTSKIRPGKESLLPEKELLENSHVLAKCMTKRRKQKVKQEGADSENKTLENVPARKYNRTKRKSLESTSQNQKRQKTKDFGLKRSEEVEIRPPAEDEEVELTVEDLMTIAEEYVRANENLDQDQAAKRACGPRIIRPARVSPRKESEDCNDAHLATADTTSYQQTSVTHDISALHESNSSTETIAISTIATGDPARDMLDLFLGPLLRKPAQEKKNDSVVEDAAFSQDFGIQSKKEIALSVKKKSSFKDKVALFLD